jgi:hypothetical protein
MSVEQRLDLDLEAFNLDAIKRSAYRFSNKFAFDVSVDGRAARCTLIFSEGDARLGIARDSRQRNPGSSETYPDSQVRYDVSDKPLIYWRSLRDSNPCYSLESCGKAVARSSAASAITNSGPPPAAGRSLDRVGEHSCLT